MKKLISVFLTAALALSLTIPAAAITTGKWDFSGIHEAIQRAAEDEEPTQSENPPISDELLQQIYAAQAAQREAAERFWNNR